MRFFDIMREFLTGAAYSWSAIPYLLKRRQETEIFSPDHPVGTDRQLTAPASFPPISIALRHPPNLVLASSSGIVGRFPKHADLEHLGH